MKMLVIFEKSKRIRHVGHLDLMRTMQRALRRSGLPVAFSNGFNPHMLLNFAAPLSVGTSGRREIMEVPLSKEISEADFKSALSAALPSDLPCIAVRAVDDKHPAPMSMLRAAAYSIEFYENARPLIDAIPRLLARDTIMVMRKTKSGEKLCDIRPMIYDLCAVDDTHISCTLSICESATCKPELLMDALYAEAGLAERSYSLYTRMQMYGENMVPLELL